MSFETQRSESTNTDGTDWEALNNYVIETANLKEPETLIGYVSMIVELGTQELEDSKMPFSGTPEDEAKILEEELERFKGKGTTYFDDCKNYQAGGQVQRHKCWKNKPSPCIALAVDFPDIMLDKGQFFEDGGNKLPLRIWLGGQFFSREHGMIMGSKTVLKENKKDFDDWSFGKKHTLHKMAVAASLCSSTEPFGGPRIEELLGKSMQFSVQIFKNHKGYYTEKCKFIGALGRGQVEAEIGSKIACVYFNHSTPMEDWKNVSNHVKNTIRTATNYVDSEAQLAIEGKTDNNTTPPPPPSQPSGVIVDDAPF